MAHPLEIDFCPLHFPAVLIRRVSSSEKCSANGCHWKPPLTCLEQLRLQGKDAAHSRAFDQRGKSLNIQNDQIIVIERFIEFIVSQSISHRQRHPCILESPVLIGSLKTTDLLVIRAI